MNRFSTALKRAFCLVAPFVALLTACKDDDEVIIANIQFDRSALYISTPSTTEVINFSAQRTESISFTEVPEGWEVELRFDARQILITSPASDDADAEVSGTITLYAYSETRNATKATLYVSSELPESIADRQSNCYVLTQTGGYSFPVDRKGEGNESLAVTSVEVLWQHPSDLISYLQMYDERSATFRVNGNSKGELLPGNALIGGYDAAGNLLWSWHMWITPSEPHSVGRYMDRNLGAAYSLHETNAEILNSYGTYYQWGRLTPFVGPHTYDCASSESALMYGSTGGVVHISYELTEDRIGTWQEALLEPLCYLLADESTDYDWNPTHDDALWSPNHKTANDPCPKGWRVADNFDDLNFAGDTAMDLSLLKKQFGWELTDGENNLFFLGGGRRSWLNGLITNVNTAENPKPWIGYYWTATAEKSNRSRALYFSLDTESPADSEFDNALASQRANGMQVRCIKE